MRIQVILDPRLPPQRLAELGALAERHGIEGVWTSSLLGCRDPFVSFVPLAMATTQLRMGPIAVNPFDTHPTRIASQLLTLNELSNGRAQIVIGGGGEALEAIGIKPERRVTAVRECVELLRRAATGKTFDFEGSLYRVRGFGCNWVESEPPRIWVGANGPQMLAMAARCADGILFSDLTGPLLSKAIAEVRAARTDQGLLPTEFSNFVAWHVYEDEREARAEARRWLAYRGLNRRWVCTTFVSDREFDLIEARMPALYRMAQGGPAPEGIPDSLFDLLVDKLSLTAHPRHLDGVLQHLGDMRQAGLTEIALRLYQQPERSIELIGREILPELR